MSPIHLLVAGASLVVAPPLLGFQAAPPAATIRGTAVDSAGQPVTGVEAVVFPDDPNKWSPPEFSSLSKRVPIVAGRFELSPLPAGSYKLVFARDTMLADWPSVELFTRLNTRKPLPIRLEPGQQVGVDAVLSVTESDVVFRDAKMMSTGTAFLATSRSPGTPLNLTPSRGRPTGPAMPVAPGVISGRVTDVDGKPLAGIEVQAMRRAVGPNGDVQFMNVGASTRTQADGTYRLTNRQPDRYVVLAQAYSMDLGAGGVSVRDVSAATDGPDGVKLGFVTTFHGGVTDQRIASVVVVGTDERNGVDITLVRRPVFDVTGSVTGLPLTSAPRWLTLAPAEGDRLSNLNVRRVRMESDGTFTVAEVPDGEYRASFSDRDGWIESRIRVSGRSPDPLVIPLRPPMIVSGRVEFQGSAPPPSDFRNLGQLAVEFAPAQMGVGAAFSRAFIQPDGTFKSSGHGPGPFRLRAIAPPPWIQVMGIVNGVDTLDIPVSGGTNLEGALIVFADRPTAVLITVRDSTERPPVGIGVIVFSEEQHYWSARSRRVQIAQTATGGTVSFSNLPPGRYLVAAGRAITVNSPITPEFVSGLKSRAQPLVLNAGESKTLDVKLN